MLSGARSLWGSATSAITNVAERLDNIVKESLADDENQEESENSVEDIEEYKRMLSDLEMQQVELSKQSRIALACKEAEIDMYKRKLSEFVHDDTALENLKFASGNGGELEYAKVQAERDALQETSLQLQEQLQVFMQSVTGAKVTSKKLVDLEKKFERTKSDLGSRIEDLEVSERQKIETIEELVGEYSKLAAEAEHGKTSESKKFAELSTHNEVLLIKVQALEQALSNIADNTPEIKTGATHVDSPNISLEKFSAVETQLGLLQSTLSGKDAEMSKTMAENSLLRREVNELKSTSVPSIPPPSNEEMEGLKAEVGRLATLLCSCERNYE